MSDIIKLPKELESCTTLHELPKGSSAIGIVKLFLGGMSPSEAESFVRTQQKTLEYIEKQFDGNLKFLIIPHKGFETMNIEFFDSKMEE